MSEQVVVVYRSSNIVGHISKVTLQSSVFWCRSSCCCDNDLMIYITDVKRSSWSTAATSISTSEAKEHPTSTKLEDGEGCRGKSLLLPYCHQVIELHLCFHWYRK